MIISGRAARYEVGLLEVLKNTKHDVDLFISVNDEYGPYYENMKKRLSCWLKGLEISTYVIDDEFFEIVNPESWHLSQQVGYPISCQKINGKYIPYNTMSCFFNDNRAFNMAIKYQNTQEIHYDCYMKFRSDIINTKIPDEIPISDIIYTAPICTFGSNGLYKNKLIVSDAWTWGRYREMSVYFNTYNFVLEMNKKYKGQILINFEDSLTDNLTQNNIKHEFFDIKYSLDLNRRIFDKNWNREDISDSRVFYQNHLNELNSHDYLDSSKVDSLDFLPAKSQ